MSQLLSSRAEAASANRPRRDAVSGALWASAVVLAALIVVELGGVFAPARSATAQSPSVAGDLTMVPAGAGDNEDVLIMIESRSEKLSVYGITGRNKVDLLQTYDLGRLFQEARAAAGAQPRP